MNYDLYAEIIQGQAGALGCIGMHAVATVIAGQLLSGWSDEKIASSWQHRARPSDYAVLLSKLVDSKVIPVSGYLYCYNGQDVERLKLVVADFTIRAPGTSRELHLYKVFPERDVFEEIEDAAVEMINGFTGIDDAYCKAISEMDRE